MRIKKVTYLFRAIKVFSSGGILFALLTMYTLVKDAIEIGCTLKGSLIYTLQSIFVRHQETIEFSYWVGSSSFDAIIIMYVIAFIIATSILANGIFNLFVGERLLRVKTPFADTLSMICVMIFTTLALMQWTAFFVSAYNGMSIIEVVEGLLPAIFCSIPALHVFGEVYNARYIERLISKKRYYLLFLIQFGVLGFYITYIYLFELADLLEMQGNPVSSLGKVSCAELKIMAPR